MIHLENTETGESKTMTIDDFKNWFNDDSTGYLSSVWTILWVQYERPLSAQQQQGGQKMTARVDKPFSIML